MVLMRGHNICFHREIRKIIFELSSIPPLICSSDIISTNVMLILAPEYVAPELTRVNISWTQIVGSLSIRRKKRIRKIDKDASYKALRVAMVREKQLENEFFPGQGKVRVLWSVMEIGKGHQKPGKCQGI